MEIRAIGGIDEYRAVEDLQKEVWAITEREIVPAIHMIAACAVGAILAGAFDRDELVGFVYGFPGLEHGEPIIHSDMLAVRAAHRDQGLGRALKLAQRDAAMARGIRRITWTFDPLQARNAHLNLAVLGATAGRYLRDFYGQTTSPLHAGGTDRLWVTWDLDPSRRPQTRGRGEVRIRIPDELSALRRQFEEAFAAGYIAAGFEDGSYVLKESAGPLNTPRGG